MVFKSKEAEKKKDHRTLVIGDVHGKVQKYKEIVDSTRLSTIQLGDFGFKKEHQWFLENITSTKHKVLFGNHDDYTFLDERHSLGNHGFINGVFHIRGAFSIDRIFRKEFVDYFPNEELSYYDMRVCMDHYALSKPSVVVSHDCPQFIAEEFFNIKESTSTRKFLDKIFEVHKPDVWIFGHHHKSKDDIIKGTRFKCLAELETFEILS